MAENSAVKSKPTWALKKNQTIGVIVIGAILLALAILIPTETGTTADTIKKLAGLIGCCTIFFGIWARPQKEGQKS